MSVSGPGRKLLLIDEDPVLLRGYAQRLRGDGWDVVTAEDGYQAVAAAQGGSWDLILLGMRIPLRGAVDVVRTLRQRKDTAETPLWVLSQAGDSDMVERALREGADGVLEKAKLAPRDIVAEVERVLDARRRGPSKTRVIESAVPAAVDEIARRLRNPEAAARAAEQATGALSQTTQLGPNATGRIGGQSAAPASATHAVHAGMSATSAVNATAASGATGSVSGRSAAHGGGNATGRSSGNATGATGATGGHLTGGVTGAMPRMTSGSASSASSARGGGPGGAAGSVGGGGPGGPGGSGWSAGPPVRRSGATVLPRSGGISQTGATTGGPTSGRISRTGDSRTGASQTGADGARGDASTGDITTSFRVGAMPGRGRRPVIPASAAISTFSSPAAAAASAAFDAAMSQPAATFDVMLNRLVGQAAGLAGSLGLPTDFLCPVCEAQLVLRLSPDPAVENGVHGHFYCGRCTGPR